jgi:prepilin peptidase CpaA
MNAPSDLAALPLPWALLALLLGLALASDIGARRIPNGLVLAGLAAGVACNAYLAHRTGLFLSDTALGAGGALLGALAGLATMLPLYLCRAMGAGDVKLMAAVGAFLGPLQVTGAALLTFAAGGLLSLAAAVGSRSLPSVLANVRLMAWVIASGRQAGLSLPDIRTTGRLPYAVAIAAGTGLQLWLAASTDWPFQ